MKKIIENIKKTDFYQALRMFSKRRRANKRLQEWKRAGRPVPPPHVAKQQVLITYAEQYGLKIFVETGTFRGDMVEAMKPFFDKLFTIELSEELYKKAKERFRNSKNVELVHGDSASKLKKIIDKIDKPTLFWLDGHYSSGITARGEKDTPVFEELLHIFNGQDFGHIIIIDDARCFGKDPAYPSISELESFILSKKPKASISVELDSIRIALQ